MIIKANSENFSDILSNISDNYTIYLSKGFYKGPFEINKSIRLIGEGKETILYNDDTILFINSNNIEIENLKIEKTINPYDNESIVKVSNIIENKPRFKNITVKGYIDDKKILWEKNEWQIPNKPVYLGSFYSGEISEKTINIIVKEKCLIESKSEYIKVISKILYPGPQELTFQIKIDEKNLINKKIEDYLLIKTSKEEFPIYLNFEIKDYYDNNEFLNLFEKKETIDKTDLIETDFIFNFSKKAAEDFINDNLDIKKEIQTSYFYNDIEEIAKKMLIKLFNNQPILFYTTYINNSKYGSKIYKFTMASDNKNYKLPDSFNDKIYEFYIIIEIDTLRKNKYILKIIGIKRLSRIFGRKPKNSLSVLIYPKLNDNLNLKYFIENLNYLPLTEDDEIDTSNIEKFKLWESYLSILNTIAEKSQYLIKFDSNNHGSDPLFITFKLNINEAYIYQNENIIKFFDEEDLLRRLKSSINSYINLIIDPNFYQYSESFLKEIGVVSHFDENNLLLTVELNDELYQENLKGRLQIPKTGYLYNNSKGDIVQIKRQQNALEYIQKGLALNPKLHEFIFDSSKAKPIKNLIKLNKEDLLLTHIYENYQQKEAVEIALSCEDLALIQGPPGTGKTTVIAEICYQMAKRGQKVLISSQTNLAVDNALSKLVHQPIIRPLRIGKAKSIAEEGLVFLEENIIDKWLKDTSNFCKTRLEKKINIVNTFKSLFDSKEKIKLYIKKEKRISHKIQKLKILYKENNYKIDNLKIITKNLENEINIQEKNYETILSSIKNINYFLDNFQNILNLLKKSLENNEYFLIFINDLKKIENEINKFFYCNNEEDWINVFVTILKRIVNDNEFYSDIKSLINHIKNLINEIKTIPEQLEKLNKEKLELEKLKIKHFKIKEEINLNLSNLTLNLNDLNTKLKKILENKTNIEYFLIRNIKSFIDNNNDQLEQLDYLIKKYISFPNNETFENIIQDFENQIINYINKIRFNNRIANVKKELIDKYNEFINKFQFNINIKNFDDKKNNLLNESIFELNIEKILEVKNKLLIKIEYFLNKRKNFFNIIFNINRKYILQLLNNLKQLINTINYNTEQNVKPIEEFLKENVDKFLSNIIDYFIKLKDNIQNKISLIRNELNSYITNINNIDKKLENINSKVIEIEKINTQKEAIIFEYFNKLISIFNELNLSLNEPWENLSINKISIFLMNIEQIIENIKNIAFINFTSNIKTIFDKKINLLKQDLLYKNEKVKFLKNKNIKINKLIDKKNSEILEFRVWWKDVWESIPERLKKDFNIKDLEEIYKVDFLEKILTFIELWKKEYEKELIYVNKYKDIIENWCKRLLNPNDIDRKQLKEIYIKNANVIGCTCSYAGSKEFNEYFENFDAVIIDEMSKVSPPELLIPAIHGKKLILIGDHKQLPPFLNDFCTDEMIELFNLDKNTIENMKQSLFKKLYLEADESIKKMLVVQYRMHPHIMTAINQFYDEKLECNFELLHEKRQHNIDDEIISKDIHLLWIDFPIKKEYYAEKQGYSYYNVSEIKAIKKICERINLFMEKENKIKDIAIITFYAAQNKLIEEEILKKNEFKFLKLKIGTVDRFQGMESPIVIVSMVHNNLEGYIGFAQEYERINVAFSRAQELLIIVGCSKLFCEENSSTKAKKAYSKVKDKVIKYGKIIDVSEL